LFLSNSPPLKQHLALVSHMFPCFVIGYHSTLGKINGPWFVRSSPLLMDLASMLLLIISCLCCCSWQDLKDHMKVCGEIIYSTVNRVNSREGLVEFKHREDMERAIDELDDSKLDGRRIKLVQESRSESRSRSRSPRSISRSRSPRKARARSASKSRSRTRSRSERKQRQRSGSRRSGDNEDRFGRQRSISRSRS